MSVDVVPPSKALVGDAGDSGVTETSSGAPSRGMLVLLCLIEAAWLGALIYGAAQIAGFALGLR